ncbi:hypothetical protein FO519_003622 [Halicephalobus sp. NKZ332]|nr:hypothetical protein FO519_003622 [Halicephalobus sp. NKZ332]
MNTLTIDHLLRAAQLFEQQTALQFGLVGRGPTSPLQLPPQSSLITIKKKSVSSVSKQSRAAHNELEKNRRANLRSYLDQIKDILPPEYDSSRDTTLSLLTRARNHMKQWRQKQESLICRRSELLIKNAKLKEKIEKAKSFRNSKKCRQTEKPSEEAKSESVQISPVIESSRTSSPIYLEYSPSNKPTSEIPSNSNSKMVTIDPYLEGLLPAAPLIYPYVYQPRSGLI